MPEAIPPVGASWDQEATQARQVHLWGQEAIPPVRCIFGVKKVRFMVKSAADR